MARTLLEEIFNQVTGRKDKPKQRDKERENLDYRMKQARFENQKNYEIAKHRAKSKGWI